MSEAKRVSITTEEALEILPVVATVIEKTDVIDYVTKFKKIGQKEGLKIVVHIFANSKECKEELYEAIAFLSKKSIEEIKTQAATETMQDLKEIMLNKDLTDFFTKAI